jgi:DNA-directed RNA polymerase subunit E'/Rpb7
METIATKRGKSNAKREVKIATMYSRSLITKNIVLPMTSIGKNIKETIEQTVAFHYEGKCIVEGFIKPESTKIITFSSGIVQRGNKIGFDVVFECEVCFPVEGTLLSCIARENTKAGIKAESADEKPSPVIVFIAKDHHYSNAYFAEVKEGDKIMVRVIGQRFELNDKFVSVLGELVKPKTNEPPKPRLVIEDL